MYNVGVEDIKNWNNFQTNNLVVGQRIIIGKSPDVGTTASEEVAASNDKESTINKVDVSADKIKKRSYKPQQQKGLVKLGDHDKLNHKFSYCIHPTAPIGTIIILTCHVNDRIILVKVVDNQPMPEGVMMQVNKTVFDSLIIQNSEFKADISFLD